MKIRTWLAGSSALAVAALSAAALVPVASDAAVTLAKGGKPPAGCAVTLDGPASKGTLTAPVMKSLLANYAGSAALAAELHFSSPGAACGSLSIVTYGKHNLVVDATPLQSRTVALTGVTSPLSIDSLIADVPADNDSLNGGPCLGIQIEVRDTNGAVVQVAPGSGPQSFCPGGGGALTFGG